MQGISPVTEIELGRKKKVGKYVYNGMMEVPNGSLYKTKC